MLVWEVSEPIFLDPSTMKIQIIDKTIATQLIAIVGFLSLSSIAKADQHKQVVNGREVVVHSNPIPVILHRMVPPQHGRHVTRKEVVSGKLPQPRPNTSIRKRS